MQVEVLAPLCFDTDTVHSTRAVRLPHRARSVPFNHGRELPGSACSA